MYKKEVRYKILHDLQDIAHSMKQSRESCNEMHKDVTQYIDGIGSLLFETYYTLVSIRNDLVSNRKDKAVEDLNELLYRLQKEKVDSGKTL